MAPQSCRTALFKRYFWLGVVLGLLSLHSRGYGQIEGSAGETDKPFTATVAIREGYDSNPLTASYQSTQDIRSSTYTSVQPSLGYNYLGMRADAAVRYDFSGTYYPSLNQSYDIQYAQTVTGRYTYAFDPRFSVTLSDNFLYTEQPLVQQFVLGGISPTFNTSTINDLLS